MEDPIYTAGPDITEHEIATVMDAMHNGWYGRQAYHYVELFEREFAAFHGRRHALMTPNATTAIHLLLAGLGIGDGDEVIVPESTWIATAAPVSYVRATPVFCDIERGTWCLDPESVERAITPRTRAIIVVDLYGNMPRMEALSALAARHGIVLVEDSAAAVGSLLHGRRAGSFGIGSVFSFHRSKTIACGEGGMLLVDDPVLHERCTILRDHGRRPGGPMYYNYEVGFKYIPSNLQAALAYAQFQRLDALVAKKRAMWNAYKEGLRDIEDLEFNPEPEGTFNSAWITALVFGTRHGLSGRSAIDAMGRLGLPLRPFFHPLSSLPAYASLRGDHAARNPVAYDIGARAVNLPGAFILTEAQIQRVCTGLRTILGRPAES